MHRGHNGHAEVDQASLVAHPEAAILRHAPLGNVQLAHDLDAAQNRRMVLACNRRHRFLQHAVDAVLHVHRVVVALNMNIRRAPFQRGKDRRVHEPDDRADVFVARQLLDGDVLVCVVLAGQHVEGQAFACFVQHALRLLGLLQQFGDLRQRGHARNHAPPQQSSNLVQDHQLRRVADCNHQRILALLLNGHKVVAEHQLHRHRAQQVMLNAEVLQVHELRAIARGQRFSLRALFRAARHRARRKRKHIRIRHRPLPLRSAGRSQ